MGPFEDHGPPGGETIARPGLAQSPMAPLSEAPRGQDLAEALAADSLEASLERAAELVGDITEPAMRRFYEAYPEARAAFEHHSAGTRRGALEAEMVERALHAAMHWLEQPGEISIQLGASVPHHQGTLKVALAWYRGLVEAVIDVIVGVIPEDRPAELALWRRIRSELGQAIEDSKSIYTPQDGAPWPHRPTD